LLASSNLKLVVGAASKTICVSAAERDEVVETIGARMAGKLVVVPNGVPLAPGSSIDARNSIRAELGVEDSVVVLSVGALDPPKDPLALARAAVSVARSGSKVVLLVVGDGGLRAEAEAIARESSGVIRVLGRRDDVAHLLTAADVFVLWSRHEGLPYALLEAMAAGLPAVVSDYPGAREVVGDAGLLVPHEKADGFAEAIRRLAADPGIRAELGGRARRRIEDRFSLEKMLDATRRVYGEVLGDPHGGG
jgi:glycosyltransferase involved in cell wall biosynthesis